MSLEKLFNDYINAGIYLKGWSPKTAIVYRRAFSSFQQSVPEVMSIPTKAQLETWVVSRRKAGVTPAGINIYIRAMNALCSWLKEEGHASENIRLKQIRVPQTQLVIFSERQVQAILAVKPKRFTLIRLSALPEKLVAVTRRVEQAWTRSRTQGGNAASEVGRRARSRQS